jgi:hypothetical protein
MDFRAGGRLDHEMKYSWNQEAVGVVVGSLFARFPDEEDSIQDADCSSSSN